MNRADDKTGTEGIAVVSAQNANSTTTLRRVARRSRLEALELEVAELRARIVELEVAREHALAAHQSVRPPQYPRFQEVTLDDVCSRWERGQSVFCNPTRREPVLCG